MLGLVIAVVVLAASVHDNSAGMALLDKVAADTDTVQKALVDQGFKNAVVAHGRTVGIEVEIVERNPGQRGFVPIPKRWIVERAYGILMLHRRLVRDYERLPCSSESRVYFLGDGRGDTAPADRGHRCRWAQHMSGGELTLGAVLARLQEREREITAQAEATRKQIAQLTTPHAPGPPLGV